MVTTRAEYARFKAANKCMRCKGPLDNDHIRCTTCEEYKQQDRSTKRALKKEAGICTSCDNPAFPPLAVCITCRDKRRGKRKFKGKNVKSDKCSVCGEYSGGFDCCDKCELKFNSWQQKYKRKVDDE